MHYNVKLTKQTHVLYKQGEKNNFSINKNKKLISTLGDEFINVTHQCKTFVLAGTEIITVIVLYKVLVVLAKPTIYMWCPHTAKPIKAIVYIENCKESLPDNLFLKKNGNNELTKPKQGIIII